MARWGVCRDAVDDAVRRISITYKVRGMVEKLTSYDNATVGSGNALNEVVFEGSSADSIRNSRVGWHAQSG